MDFADFLSLFAATHIYDGGKNMAMFVGATITPVLLVIAIWLRLGSTQLESATSGSGKWASFFKDMMVWLTILGLYFALAGMLSDLFNAMYTHFNERGSLGAILARFAELIEDIDKAGDDADLLSQSLSLLSSPVTFVIWLFYYFSFLLATIMIKFLQLAHAICWSFALVWGLVAIPMSITSNFKLLKGWAIFSGISLLWPIIHFGGFALFNPIFQHAANEFVSGAGAGLASIDKSQLYLIMTVVNVLAVSIAIAAPFITMSLISNSGSIAGVVAPFASAAVATAAAAMSKARVAGSSVGNVGRVAGGDMLAGRNPLSRVERGISNIRQSIMGPSPDGDSTPLSGSSTSQSSGGSFRPSVADPSQAVNTPANATQPEPGNARSTPKSPLSKAATAVASSAGVSGPVESSIADQHSVEPEQTEQEKQKRTPTQKKQDRRGAIINQFNKSRFTGKP